MPSIMEKVIYKVGQRVRVIGSIEWGMNIYHVDTEGEIQEDTGLRKILVLLDEVDGDKKVCLYIPRNIVTQIL